MVFAQVSGTRIWYEQWGREGAPPVVLLHGWGASLETLRSVATCLAPTYRVYALDFPGFGQSPPPPRPWTVGDYTAALRELLGQWRLGPARFIGHSFGGRVAIMLAAHQPDLVDRLILVDSAGIRPPRSFRGHLFGSLGRASRVLVALPGLSGPGERLRAALAARMGSSDYAAARGTMRETFVRVVEEDLTPLLPYIQASTLLIWGDRDQDTPLTDARLMEQRIPDAGLVVFAGAGHYSYLDRPDEFCAVARHFLADPAAAPSGQPPPRGLPPASLTSRARPGVPASDVAVWAALVAAALGGTAVVALALRFLLASGAGTVLWVLLALLTALPWALLALRRITAFLHVLQLEEYDVGRYWRWARTHTARAWPVPAATGSVAAAVALLLSIAFNLPTGVEVVIALCWGAAGGYLFATSRPARSNKALVYTRKAQAVLALALGLTALMVAGVTYVATLLPLAAQGDRSLLLLPGVITGACLAVFTAAPSVLGGNALLYPAQAAAKRRVVARAAARLRARPDLVVVGISGAYGKTSVKEILAALLAARYRVLKTPESYNTPLGIAGVVLRELRPEHEVFVVEMGSYGPGDVAYLCRMARPRVGIMTAIGPMHLERFGTVEAIARTDYELIEALPSSGTAIFNADNQWCRELAAETPSKRVVRATLARGPESDLWASGVVTTGNGLQFTIHDRTGQAAPFQVELLGAHSVTNVLLATAAAMACGMSLQEVAHAAVHIRPVPHRLQLIRGSGGVTVIDDGYNANPDGMAAGLEVLREMPGRRKVLVTPGMVELGAREEEEHRKLGRLAAAVCDTVLLVGPRRTRPILEGLREGGFPVDRAIVVRSAAERDAQLARLAGAGDVVLIANDLPDQYDE